jgi:hypothetical protein
VVSLSELERRLSRRIGDDFAGVTTGSGDTAGTLLLSSDLLIRPAQGWTAFTCEITSGENDGVERVVRSFSNQGGDPTLEFYHAFPNSVGISTNYRMHRIPLRYKYEAINEVLPEMHVFSPIRVTEYMMTGELLRNRNFEWWHRGVPYDWKVSADLAQQATLAAAVRTGDSSLRIADGNIRQKIPIFPELFGVPLTVSAWFYHSRATTTNTTLRIMQGNTTLAFATVPTVDTEGVFEWREATATASPTRFDTGDLEIRVQTSIPVADEMYVDAMSLRPPRSSRVSWIAVSDYYRTPLSLVEIGPVEEWQGPVVWPYRHHPLPSRYENGYGLYTLGGGGRMYPYPELINQGAGGVLPNLYTLKITGLGTFPVLESPTDELDIDEDGATLLVLRAAIRLMHKAKFLNHMADDDHWNAVEQDLLNEIQTAAPVLRAARPTVRY